MEKTRGDNMVAIPLEITEFPDSQEELKPPVKWTTVSLEEIVNNSFRLEASVYGIEGRQAREVLSKCKWNIAYLDSFLKNAFYLGRFKRIYVDKKDGIPFILPSQISEIYPKATKFISPETNVDIKTTLLKRGQILVTRSGTIGNISYVSKSLENKSLSDDVIRIEAEEYPGFLYIYLKSKIGRLLIETNNYGAVVSHIEPEHLKNIPIPNPPVMIKKEIHDLIEKSFRLRDESNELMDKAQEMLKYSLQFPDIEELRKTSPKFEDKASFLNYSVPIANLDNRLDASYHIPIAKKIEDHLCKYAKEVTTIGDKRVSQSVILPGRFKRIYVEEGSGIIFFGGKQIYELDPSNKKYLSLNHHADRIDDELKVQTNTILITRSGTIGKVVIVPEHWNNWIPNEHIIRINPTSESIAGYLYAWLTSEYAYPLITRFTYGAVVDEIDDKQVSKIPVPLLKDDNIITEINSMVLKANKKRSHAYELEQKALSILNKKVIYSSLSNNI
jgi:type I restriction enzyme S subunit